MTGAAKISARAIETLPGKKVYQKPTLTEYGRRDDGPTEDSPALEEPRSPVDDAPERSDSRTTRVLVVDDDTFMRQVLRDHLEEWGFQVATAADGSEGFRVIPEFNPHVVVMDVVMPGENGYRVSRALKELGSHGMDAAPKIILLTGRRVDDDPEREAMLLRFSRADAMLYKPLDPAHLRESIVRLLET